jgi:hypothetical protein
VDDEEDDDDEDVVDVLPGIQSTKINHRQPTIDHYDSNVDDNEVPN